MRSANENKENIRDLRTLCNQLHKELEKKDSKVNSMVNEIKSIRNTLVAQQVYKI